MVYSPPAAFDEDKYAWAGKAAYAGADATYTANSQGAINSTAAALVAAGMAESYATAGAAYTAAEQAIVGAMLAVARDKGVISNTVASPFVSPFVGVDGRYVGGSGIADQAVTYTATVQAAINNLITACKARGLVALD